MNETKIFRDSRGEEFGLTRIVEILKSLGAADCDFLFVHSDIGFGLPIRGIRRGEYLGLLLRALETLAVKNLIMPAFTYSFPNRERFDLVNSRTHMGALNEYFRKEPGVKRSLDPLLSVAMRGPDTAIMEGIGKHSLGKNSFFDRLHNCKNVKFLCYGAQFAEIFTYLHYVEKMLDVPYRYDQPFTGEICNPNGDVYQDTWTIHTACYGVRPACHYYFQDELIRSGYMKSAVLGDLPVTCIDEAAVFSAIVNKIETNVYYFLEKPFTQADLVHRYQYELGPDCPRVAHC